MMRLLSFYSSGTPAVGIRFGEDVVDLSIAAPHLPRTLLDLIRCDLLIEAHDAAKRCGTAAYIPAHTLQWLPVIPHPPKIFGFGINYGSHVGARPECPGFFISTSTRLAAHAEPMVIPKASATLDYEVELAVILKKGGKNIARRDALDHVAGYSILNDGSVRGYGAGESLAFMKNSDKTAPFGPELVTPDELPSGAAGLRMRTRRNAVEVQNETTDAMFWKIPEIIEIASQYMTLNAGDVITTGTPGGTLVESALRNGLPLGDPSIDWLREGDVIECEIEGIGSIRNPVTAELPNSFSIRSKISR
jgi:2-keto-4-pentenoate hydratase/2-oxohepta-3-ene-1,7-dioic acid hydratase in catechol pathway